MEKIISNRLSAYAAISIGIFLLNSLIYVAIGVDGVDGWWAFDKINDRVFAINLLLITSFCFVDVLYRLLAYFGSFFIAMYAAYEVAFIFGYPILPSDFINIATIYWIFISIIYLIIHVSSRTK